MSKETNKQIEEAIENLTLAEIKKKKKIKGKFVTLGPKDDHRLKEKKKTEK